MYCNMCGKQIGPDAVFCQYCGVRVSAATPAVRRLMRSRADRKIAGVCAGVARYLDVDVTAVRLIWLLCVVLGGTGLLAYLIGWVILPEEPEVVLMRQAS